jgi:hypothetical protein
MKIKSIAQVTILLSTTILAAPIAPRFSHASDVQQNFCLELESLARSAATGRYGGIPITRFYEIIDGNLPENPNETTLGANRIMKAITNDAYSLPAYSTKKMQQREINEFANRVFIYCNDIADRASE